MAFTTGAPGAPPAWVQSAARSVAAESDSPKPTSCEWILTTVKKAAPLLGLTAQDPTVKADPNLKVYIIIEHGMFKQCEVRPGVWGLAAAAGALVRELHGRHVQAAAARRFAPPAGPIRRRVGKMNVFTF